jgi:cyclopropane-fatty-acyl-phospholipid synthase
MLELAAQNMEEIDATIRGSWPLRALNRLRHLRRRNSRRGSGRNISEHYDLGNDFYAEWLDPGMTYSSGIYVTDGASLEEAQAAKYRRVIELLDLKGGESVLEVGCGWGGMAEALTRNGVGRVTAITLSRAQLDYTVARLGSAAVDVRLTDYRDIGGRFDRIVSIEMLEAVGEENWPRYFDVLRQRLNDGGSAVLQAITIADHRYESYRRGADFIQRHIFPGGMLPSPAILKREIARAGFALTAVDAFGVSYARTLADWQRRFQSAWPRIAALGFPAQFKRKWEYYLAYCEAGFRAGLIDVGLYRIEKARG